jgi:ATP-dependent DNA helicase RecG
MLKETQHIEFKLKFNEDVIETLVAFANTKGGRVFVGVDDDGKPLKSFRIGKESVQKWVNEVKNKTQPQIIPDWELVNINGKEVVEMSVQEYPIKPVGTRGRYYRRVQNSNHLLSVSEVVNMHLQTINSSWDYYADPNHTFDNLSKEKIAVFTDKLREKGVFGSKMSDMDILEKLEFVRDGRPTFGCYFLFVDGYCPASDIQIGRFKSPVTIIDSISLNSDLFGEVTDILAFIKKHLMVEYIITGEPQRIERFDYPTDAIREVVINMIVHRDYRNSSGSVIKIFDDRIEFYNPGKLYGGNTIEALLSGKYSSQSRNKLVAKAFKEMGEIEKYGTGITRVQEICRNYGVKEPLFQEITDGFQVTLYKEKLSDFVLPANAILFDNSKTDLKTTKTDLKTTKTDLKTTETDLKTTETDLKTTETDLKTTETDLKTVDIDNLILSLIEENNQITIPDIAQKTGKKLTATKDRLNKLKATGLIERIDGKKGGYWKIVK